MSKVNMSKVNMSKVNMSKVNMSKVNMSKVNMSKVNMSKITWVKFVSKEYAIDNLYMDYEEGFVYLNEDDYLLNKKQPVWANATFDELGKTIKMNTNDLSDIMDFIEEIYTPEDNPEYYV